MGIGSCDINPRRFSNFAVANLEGALVFWVFVDHFAVVANAMQNESGRGEKKSWFDADLKN